MADAGPDVLEAARAAEHVLLLTLNRPAKRNALNPALRTALAAALAEAEADDSVRVAILTGAGSGFCSGADITPGGSTPAPTQSDHLDDIGWVGALALAVHGFGKPLIAAVNGAAVGAGMSLALACDLRVGCPGSRFQSLFVARGVSPEAGLSYFLPRIVGYSRAAELIYANRAVDAHEAHRIGLLDRLAESEEDLLDAALELAAQIAVWPPLALRASKRVLQRNAMGDLQAAVRCEKTGIDAANRAVNDRREAFAAFREKRAPIFTGT